MSSKARVHVVGRMNTDLKIDLQVPFPSAKEAEIAYNTLRIDAEPKRGGVKKILFVEENVMKVKFTAHEARILRVSVNSFLDHLGLVIETIEKFGPPKSAV